MISPLPLWSHVLIDDLQQPFIKYIMIENAIAGICIHCDLHMADNQYPGIAGFLLNRIENLKSCLLLLSFVLPTINSI